MSFLYVEVGMDNLPIADTQSAIDGSYYYDNYVVRPVTYSNLISNFDQIRFGLQNNTAVGSIRFMKRIFRELDKNPRSEDYPEELNNFVFTKRRINKSTIRDIKKYNFTQDHWIKPVETKVFDAFPISNGLEILSEFSDDLELWVSDSINIKSEWRFYIYNGEIVHGCCYQGDIFLSIEKVKQFIYSMLEEWKNKPCAFTFDIGILENSESCLIEVNDFWAIGNYGLKSHIYFSMLRDRYKEIVNES